MILLLDVGNTHTHTGLAGPRRILRVGQVPTAWCGSARGAQWLDRWVGGAPLEGAAIASVAPAATAAWRRLLRRRWRLVPRELTARTLVGLGVRYSRPRTIGADRLANALAARHLHGAPVVAVDFGTATTVDVVDAAGDFVGGAIVPGVACWTEYLHARTALLPRIRLWDVKGAIGRSTAQALRIGAVRGYRGLVRELLAGVRQALGRRRMPVVATGGYAPLMCKGLAGIAAIEPRLTLEGLRLAWAAWEAQSRPPTRRSGLERPAGCWHRCAR